MKRLNRRGALSVLAVTVSAVLFGGCQGQATATSSSVTTTPGTANITSNGGVACTSSQFCVNVNPPTGTTMVLHQDSATPTQSCYANVGTGQACILEAGEEDLYQQGFTMTYSVPTGMCSFLHVTPYSYYQFPPGIGPSAVSLTINADTSVTLTPATGMNASAVLNGSTLSCSTDYSWQVSAPSVGPNCCVGPYMVTTIDNSVTPSTKTTTSGDWGGNANNCLNGPAVDSQTKDANGYPETTVYPLDGQSFSKTYTVVDPGGTKQYFSNAYISNYWNSGLTGSYPATTGGGALGAPTAMVGPGVFNPGSPWYDFECYDAAHEWIAGIRVLVRSWSTQAQFTAFQSANMGPGTGIFNLFGTETTGWGPQALQDYETWVIPTSPTLGAGSQGTIYSLAQFLAAPLSSPLPGTQNENMNGGGHAIGFGNIYPGLAN